MTSHAQWTATLDALAAHVAALRAAPQTATSTPAFTAPPGLGPLPVELVARATAVLASCRALEEDLAADMSALARQIDQAAHAQPQRESTRLFFDGTM